MFLKHGVVQEIVAAPAYLRRGGSGGLRPTGESEETFFILSVGGTADRSAFLCHSHRGHPPLDLWGGD